MERRQGMSEVTEQLGAIREAVEHFAAAAETPKEEFRRSRRDVYIVGAAVALIVTVLGFINLMSLRGTDNVLERLEDCTTPTGECYQQLTGDGTEREIITRLEGIRCLIVAQGQGDSITPCLREGGSR